MEKVCVMLQYYVKYIEDTKKIWISLIICHSIHYIDHRAPHFLNISISHEKATSLDHKRRLHYKWWLTWLWLTSAFHMVSFIRVPGKSSDYRAYKLIIGLLEKRCHCCIVDMREERYPWKNKSWQWLKGRT